VLPEIDPTLEEELGVLKTRNTQVRVCLTEVDRDLQEISAGVMGLKEIATDLNKELEEQREMLDVLESRTDQLNQQFDNLNYKMKTSVEKVEI
jgi:chromosome segregation ATPase